MNHIKIMPSLKPKTSRSIGKSDTKMQFAKTKSIAKKKIVLKHKKNTNEEKEIIKDIGEKEAKDIIEENDQEIISDVVKHEEKVDENKINETEEEELTENDEDNDKPSSQRSRKRNKNYGRETRYNKKKIEFEFGVNDDEITGQQETLMVPLTKFFEQNNNIERILPILKGHSPISLRIIDWFVTNYSKEMGTVYDIKEYSQKLGSDNENSIVSGFDSLFFVHYDYRCQLKSFYKKKFDPFCRKTKIQFNYQPEKFIITTVGQLNFFRWAIKNYVLNYIEDNLEAIEDHMNNNIKVAKVNDFNDEKPSSPKNQNQISGQTKRRKRKEISPSAMRSITKYNSPVTVSFN